MDMKTEEFKDGEWVLLFPTRNMPRNYRVFSFLGDIRNDDNDPLTPRPNIVTTQDEDGHYIIVCTLHDLVSFDYLTPYFMLRKETYHEILPAWYFKLLSDMLALGKDPKTIRFVMSFSW